MKTRSVRRNPRYWIRHGGDDGEGTLLDEIGNQERQEQAQGYRWDDQPSIAYPDEHGRGRDGAHIALARKGEDQRIGYGQRRQHEQRANGTGALSKEQAGERRQQHDEREAEQAITAVPGGADDRLADAPYAFLHHTPHAQRRRRGAKDRREEADILLRAYRRNDYEIEERHLHGLQEEESRAVELGRETRRPAKGAPEHRGQFHDDQTEERSVQRRRGPALAAEGESCEPGAGQRHHQHILGTYRHRERQLRQQNHGRNDRQERDPQIDERAGGDGQAHESNDGEGADLPDGQSQGQRQSEGDDDENGRSLCWSHLC